MFRAVINQPIEVRLNIKVRLMNHDAARNDTKAHETGGVNFVCLVRTISCGFVVKIPTFTLLCDKIF